MHSYCIIHVLYKVKINMKYNKNKNNININANISNIIDKMETANKGQRTFLTEIGSRSNWLKMYYVVI